MNEGSYVLTQAFNLVPRQIFQRLVKKYSGDYRVREFNCTNQLRYMLYGQLTACELLRDICMCLCAFPGSLYGIGITATVGESTLSRANESRDYRIYEGLGQAMIKIVQPLYSKMRIDYIWPQDHDLYALDSKHLLGCSENAVKTHLWIAVIAHLLLARIKAIYDSPYTITEIGVLIKNFSMTKVDLKTLVTEPQPLIRNQDVNELTLF